MRIRGDQWQKIRKLVLMRDAGICQVCKAKGQLTIGSEVDHIEPLNNGGSNELYNLQLLCADCHAEKTRNDLGQRQRIAFGLDGWPILD
jgi:5-methylcytosine-specific restriction enzyme A